MVNKGNLLLFLGAVVGGLRGVRASVTTEAFCTTNSTYLYNSIGQSPCLVAAYLLSACTDGDWDLPALDSNNTGYQASTGNGTYVPCICSTVVYSLAAACSVCQLGLGVYSSWTGYSTACTSVFDRQLPMGIPSGTAVPPWAYQNVIQQGGFDIDLVNTTTGPDSTVAVNGPTSTTSIFSSSSSASGTGTITPTPAPAPSSGKSSNAGAIAGGVVGGVVGLAAVGLLAFFLIRRQNAKHNEISKRNSTNILGAGASPGAGYAPSSYYGGSPQMAQTLSPVSGNYGTPPTPGSAGPLLEGQKYYNPDDPSTFPTTTPSPYPSETTNATGTDNRAYRGFPEV